MRTHILFSVHMQTSHTSMRRIICLIYKTIQYVCYRCLKYLDIWYIDGEREREREREKDVIFGL